ncbi:MAG: alpha/beta hydrolase [Steroidobacter sp.]
MPEDESVLTRPAGAPDKTVRYGTEAEQIADLRLGDRHTGRRPLVVILHGGFWKPAYDRTHTGPMAAALAEGGWTVASAEYRRIPGNPDATLEDVSLLLNHLRTQTSHHNGRIVLIGHSAGGHLALWAAATLKETPLLGVLALAPVADLQLARERELGSGAVMAFLGVAPESRPDLDPRRLPGVAVATTILHGDADETVPFAITESYVAAHPDTRLVRLVRTGHYGIIDPLSDAWPTVVEELRRLSRL